MSPPGRFTTILNSMQFLVAAPCRLSFKERFPARPRHTITDAPETIRTSELCRRSFHARSKRAKSGPLPLGGVSSIEGLRAPVAQLDRALPSEGKGRTFESSRARHRLVPRSPRFVSASLRGIACRRCAPRLRHLKRADLHHRPRLEHDRHQPIAKRLGRCRLEQEFIGARA
jgi:hypothetical protein